MTFAIFLILGNGYVTAMENSYILCDFEHEFQLHYSTDNRTNRELTILELLDREITIVLKDPTGITNRVVTGKDGEILLKNVYLFEKYVHKAKLMWKDRRIKQDELLKRSARILFNKGGPQFLLVILTNQTNFLMEALKLGANEFYEFFHVRSEANKVWDELSAIISCE